MGSTSGTGGSAPMAVVVGASGEPSVVVDPSDGRAVVSEDRVTVPPAVQPATSRSTTATASPLPRDRWSAADDTAAPPLGQDVVEHVVDRDGAHQPAGVVADR